MKVTIKLIGPFVATAGFSEKEFEVPEGTTPESLLTVVSLLNPKPKIITRNGRAVSQQEVLRDGDRIVISPIYSGG